MLASLRARYACTGDEWDKVWRLALLFFLLGVGSEIGRIARDSLFLSKVGAVQIPYMYIFVAITMIAMSFTYGRFIARVRADRLMIVIQSSGAIIFFAFWYLSSSQANVWRYLPHMLFCAVEAYVLFVTMHFWTYANSLFNANQGRRFFPLLGTIGVLGIVSAGLLTQVVTRVMGSSYLLLLWSALLLASMYSTYMVKSVAAICSWNGSNVRDTTLELRLSLHGLKGIWAEPLVRTLAFMAFPMWILIYIIDYCYFDTLNRTFSNQDELAGFLGLCVGLFSFLGLLVQALLTPRLLKHLGVGATSVVFPLTLTVGAACLLLYTILPGSDAPSLEFGTLVLLVLIARFCDVGIYFSVFDSTSQLLYYAVPPERQAQSRAFISGIIFPVSMALAGVVILYFRGLGEPLYNVAFVGFAMAFLLVALGLNITPDYLKALISHPHTEHGLQRQDVLDEMVKIGNSDTYYVLLQSLTSADPAESGFALQRIMQLEVRDKFLDFAEIVQQINPTTLGEMVESFGQTASVESAHFYAMARARLDSRC